VGQKSIFAYTQDNELVVMKTAAEGLAEVQKEDIVEFTPKPWLGPSTDKTQGLERPYKVQAKWFGSFPAIIARKWDNTHRVDGEVEPDLQNQN